MAMDQGAAVPILDRESTLVAASRTGAYVDPAGAAEPQGLGDVASRAHTWSLPSMIRTGFAIGSTTVTPHRTQSVAARGPGTCSCSREATAWATGENGGRMLYSRHAAHSDLISGP